MKIYTFTPRFNFLPSFRDKKPVPLDKSWQIQESSQIVLQTASFLEMLTANPGAYCGAYSAFYVYCALSSPHSIIRKAFSEGDWVTFQRELTAFRDRHFPPTKPKVFDIHLIKALYRDGFNVSVINPSPYFDKDGIYKTEADRTSRIARRGMEKLFELEPAKEIPQLAYELSKSVDFTHTHEAFKSLEPDIMSRGILTYRASITPELMKDIVARGGYIIVNVSRRRLIEGEGPFSYGHFCVIAGYNFKDGDRSFYMFEPGYGSLSKETHPPTADFIKAERLIYAGSDNSYQLEQPLIVVFPPDNEKIGYRKSMQHLMHAYL